MELAETMRKPKLRRYEIDDRDIEDALWILGATLPHVDVDVTLRDPRDAPVVAAAVAGHADAIVTGDADLLDDQPLRSWLAERRIEIVTPAEFVHRSLD
jgi:putative PIN family toxin of toxin-antitoxin system